MALTNEVKNGIRRRSPMHWKEFIELFYDDHSNVPSFIYRGQAHDWKLFSSLDRLEKRFSTKPNYSGDVPKKFNVPPTGRDEHLNAFKEAARGRTSALPYDAPEDEWWVLAQHHGLKTPLLDWTLYPFAALYFAFEEDQVVVDGSLETPTNRYVYRLSWHLIEDNNSSSNLTPYPYVPKTSASNRYINQNAVAIKMPAKTSLESHIENLFCSKNKSLRDSDAVLEIISIKNEDEDRKDCLKFLNKMGMNRLTLFPDLDGAAYYINALWELDFDTSMGQINSYRDRKAT